MLEDALIAFIAAPPVQLLIGGGAGGVARWILLQPKAWSDRIGMVVLGIILGFYVSPELEPTLLSAMTSGVLFGVHLTIDEDKLPGFSAFATGVLGIALLGFGVDWFNSFRKQREEAETIDPLSPKPDGSPK